MKFNSFELYPHQNTLFNKSFPILKKYNLVYLACEERVGKSLVALKLVEEYFSDVAFKCLIITKKKAVCGWETFLGGDSRFEVVNFEALTKIKHRSGEFSFAIVDEAHHALGGFPRPPQTSKRVQMFCYDLPIIFCSATPCAQTYASLFHQLNITKFSPWDKYPSFYAWFEEWGIPTTQRVTGGLQVKKYDVIKIEGVRPVLDKFFVFMTREEAGFKVHPNDKLHFVELRSETKERIRELVKNRNLEDPKYRADSPGKLLKALHQIEGGTLKLGDKLTWFAESFEKVDYVLRVFGDKPDMVIFHEYIAEGLVLRNRFQKAEILQASTFAEGVDLSHKKTLIVYSQNFSASKYIQRRARQCNRNRKDDIVVHFLLCRNLISDQVYDCVTNKHKNFTLSLYKPIDARI